MKVLGQINYILEGFFITDILSLANLRIAVLGLLGSFMYSNAIYSTFFLKAFFMEKKLKFNILKVTALLRYCITVKKKHLQGYVYGHPYGLEKRKPSLEKCHPQTYFHNKTAGKCSLQATASVLG